MEYGHRTVTHHVQARTLTRSWLGLGVLVQDDACCCVVWALTAVEMRLSGTAQHLTRLNRQQHAGLLIVDLPQQDRWHDQIADNLAGHRQ